MNFLLSYFNELLLFSENRFFIAILIYFFFLFFYSVISFPGLVIFVAISGYLFGIYYSYLISIIAITSGTLVFNGTSVVITSTNITVGGTAGNDSGRPSSIAVSQR